ncbi:MAG: hypothetical protein J0L92_13305 [Deltaproteobacteria bacterium]|nr:hypothetical protein [Deltaproteobacteria bacterium]
MSTSVDEARPTPHRRPTLRSAGTAATFVLSLGLAGCTSALAQAPEGGDEAPEDPALTPVDVLTGGMAAYVDALAVETGDWRGQRVPWPAVSARPPSEVTRTSWLWPATVHGTTDTLDAALAARWMDAIDHAYRFLHDAGWPLPPLDGGRDGSDGFDVYVIDRPIADEPTDTLDPDLTREGRRSASRFDAPLFDQRHDAAIVHAVVDRDVPDDRLDACAIQLVASAGLFAADPAEAESLREATAAWLAWSATGHLGCDEDALTRQQHASHRALVTMDARDGEGAAIFLGAMSARHDGLETDFLRDVWSMARQRTRDGGDLQGEPDVLRVLQQASTLAHDPMDRVVESMAVARYFAGGREGAARPDVPLLAALGADARVPVFVSSSWERLPRTLRPAPDAPPLEPWGSAYARVDVRGAPSGSVLRVWLDGELGTEWSLVAVRLDAHGAERGRTRAPPTRTARGYIPVELGEGTTEVVLVVTNLPDDDDLRDRNPSASRDATIAGRLHRVGLDADTPGPGPHAFRLIVDRGP